MPRICQDWCELDHEHNFDSSSQQTFTKREVLTTAERDSLELQLGFRPRTRSDIDGHMKANNFEFVSPSGSDGQFRREMHEWVKEPPDRRGPPPKKRN